MFGTDNIIALPFLDKDILSKNMVDIDAIPDASLKAAPTCFAIKISLLDKSFTKFRSG